MENRMSRYVLISTRILFCNLLALAIFLTTTFATHRSYLRVETVNASTVPNQLDGTPDRGSITQNVYENQFFGFSYRLPDRWVYDKEAALEYNSIEQRRGKEPDPKLEELHELWQSKSYVLLVTSEMSQTRLPLHGPGCSLELLLDYHGTRIRPISICSPSSHKVTRTPLPKL